MVLELRKEGVSAPQAGDRIVYLGGYLEVAIVNGDTVHYIQNERGGGFPEGRPR